MRLSISNIAWDPAEDELIASLLNECGVDGIDIAPGKYFSEPAKATDNEISIVKEWWSSQGIEVCGMQALLFGTSGLNLFGTAEVQNAMLKHLKAVCRIAGGLGGKRLVFGSPKNRDRTGLSDEHAIELAVPFFRSLGDIADEQGVIICLEPNPRCYGANFMTSSAETAAVVNQVAHPAIKMQLDTGASTINDEDIFEVLKSYGPLIGHVHASEPNLVPLGDGSTAHGKASQALAQYLPKHVVTIEMVATSNEAHEIAIKRALNVAIAAYRND